MENCTAFVAQNPLTKPASNNLHSSGKICSEIAPRSREYSEITNNGNTISEITPNNSHSLDKIENANIPHSLFALNHSTNQLDKNFNNFQRIAGSLLPNCFDDVAVR